MKKVNSEFLWTRRSMLFVLASLAGAAAASPFKLQSSLKGFPNLLSLKASLEHSIKSLGKKAKIQNLGQSQFGRSIDLITIGSGSRSVLVVGAPHPNEPIGYVTVVRLIQRLASDPQFLKQSDATWHFIPAIDIDGLELNSGWMEPAPTLDNYMRHFFRPAFTSQPEYTFPLDLSDYKFDKSTPENLCWQRAFEIAKPALHFSLHCCDTGGAFYLMSKPLYGLANVLSKQPEELGLTLNDVGEKGINSVQYAKGVFADFSISDLQRQAIESGSDLSSFWAAGSSSSDYAAEQYGSVSIICEAPIWEDVRERSCLISDQTMADIIREVLRQTVENEQLLYAGRELIRTKHETFEKRALATALSEADVQLSSRSNSLQETLEFANANDLISQKNVARLDERLFAMRAPAMLARLATLCNEKNLANEAGALVARRISDFYAKTKLIHVPIEKSTMLQMQSITTALDFMNT